MPSPAMLDAVVLAAGLSRRMGRPKPLLPAGEGATLLSRALDAATAVDGRLWVVLGAAAGAVRAEAERWARLRGEEARLRCLFNPDFASGLASSVAAGVRAATSREPPQGILLLVADQPALERRHVTRLVEAFRRRGAAQAVAAAEEGELRNPAAFARELFDELLALEGDAGGRQILARHPGRVLRVELGSGPWFRDVDDPEAYARLLPKLCGAEARGAAGDAEGEISQKGWRA
ncbi:MAG: nucleotidyltransferase family protein [Bacillota bacterium]|nr:nucleotidyltransferase family protein [Bacillota bacterium]